MKWKCVAAIIILLSIVLRGDRSPIRLWAQDNAAEKSPNAGSIDLAGTPLADSDLARANRMRAKLLHETLHGSLLVMHRDFFSEETSRVLPSQSLLSVFSELKRSHGVEVRWMTVSGDEMNEDHRPVTPFEREAADRIKQGAEYHESLDDESYRYIGRIRLASECLKCHVSRRKSTEDRASGLIITIKLTGNGTASAD